MLFCFYSPIAILQRYLPSDDANPDGVAPPPHIGAMMAPMHLLADVHRWQLDLG